jgi:uncharacterized membrane protein
MSNLIVVKFETLEEAEQALDTLKAGAKTGYMKLEDTAIVYRDLEGKVDVKGSSSAGTVGGAIIGGALGLLLGGIFAPVLATAFGAAGGALVGHSLGDHVDKDFVNDVAEHLEPGKAALFCWVTGEPGAVIASLQPYEGQVLQSTLDSEADEALRKALE